MTKVKHPFGKADSQSLAHSAAITIEVENSLTKVVLGTMTSAATLSIVPKAGHTPEIGDMVLVLVQGDGTARLLEGGNNVTMPIKNIYSSQVYFTFRYTGATWHRESENETT